MGFLRKVAKKVKKRFKKLFSSKLGRFLGSIALGMMLGPVVSKAFNGIKGFFSGVATSAQYKKYSQRKARHFIWQRPNCDRIFL